MWVSGFFYEASVLSYPASRGYIFAACAGVRKVASADDRSIFYRAFAKIVTRFVSKINRRQITKNEKSTDYCKADLKQRVLFFITIFRHSSL